MSGPANPHKKGEHVFNDLSGSLDNAFEGAVRTRKADSLVLANRFGSLRLSSLQQTSMLLERFRTDPVLIRARTVVGPATGIEADENSRKYGDVRARLEGVLADIVVSTAGLQWKKRPRSNSSFHEFEAIVAGMGNLGSLKSTARDAMDLLFDSAYDPAAEKGALAEKISDTELTRRKEAIAAMKEHLPQLKDRARSLVNMFVLEVEQELERRIGPA